MLFQIHGHWKTFWFLHLTMSSCNHRSFAILTWLFHGSPSLSQATEPVSALTNFKAFFFPSQSRYDASLKMFKSPDSELRAKKTKKHRISRLSGLQHLAQRAHRQRCQSFGLERIKRQSDRVKYTPSRDRLWKFMVDSSLDFGKS